MSTGRIKDMAAIVVRTGLSPESFWSLTIPEYNAIVTELNRAAKRR